MSVQYSGTGVTFADGSSQTTAPTGFGFKNRIINGAMMIDQRNAGASVTPIDGSYTLDRWFIYQFVASKFSVQQNAGSVTPPVGFSKYFGATSLSAYTVGASETFGVGQFIEGFNTADLAWGTANAKTVTLSFQVYSSLTGTFGGSIQNSAANRSYPFSYTVSSANTWTTVSVTIPGDTTGTWIGATNGKGMLVYFSIGSGSTYSGTSGSWAGAQYFSATGATSVVGTNGATFYITGVQLEKGSVATPFDYRPYGTELALCQRYYQVLASGTNSPFGMAGYYTASNLAGYFAIPTTMRTSPTINQTTGVDYYTVQTNGNVDKFNSISLDRATPQGLMWYNITEVSGTGGNAGPTFGINASAYIAVQAEL